MSERSEQIVGAFVVGSLLPVLVVVWVGLLNEGFSSFAFLFYPGPETWFQLALFGLFGVLLWLSFPALQVHASHMPRGALVPVLVASLVGLSLASAVLYLVGLGETPWRKFYTYVVAPRAVSAWLLCAVIVLLAYRRPHTWWHAA